MSYQALEAVQDHSQFQGPKMYVPFRILLAIASFADANGVAGVRGQPHKCPSIRTLAAKANVHRNTVLNNLPRLVAAGELSIERGGAGRGAWSVYRLHLPALGKQAAPRQETAPAAAPAPEPAQLAETVARLAAEVAQLQRELAQSEETTTRSETTTTQCETTMAQAKGTNGPKRQRTAVPDPEDPVQDPEAIRGDPPADDATAAAMTEVLAAVCGLDLSIPAHREDCRRAARQLRRYDAGWLRRRYAPPDGATAAPGWSWYRDDWRGRKGEQPTPALVVATVGKERHAPSLPLAGRDAGSVGSEGRRDGGSPAERAARDYADMKRRLRERRP